LPAPESAEAPAHLAEVGAEGAHALGAVEAARPIVIERADATRVPEAAPSAIAPPAMLLPVAAPVALVDVTVVARVEVIPGVPGSPRRRLPGPRVVDLSAGRRGRLARVRVPHGDPASRRRRPGPRVDRRAPAPVGVVAGVDVTDPRTLAGRQRARPGVVRGPDVVGPLVPRPGVEARRRAGDGGRRSPVVIHVARRGRPTAGAPRRGAVRSPGGAVHRPPPRVGPPRPGPGRGAPGPAEAEAHGPAGPGRVGDRRRDSICHRRAVPDRAD